MIVFPYQRLPRDIVESIPPDYFIGRSDSGWMIAPTFYEYVANCFYPWLIKNSIQFPVLLLVDGHTSIQNSVNFVMLRKLFCIAFQQMPQMFCSQQLLVCFVLSRQIGEVQSENGKKVMLTKLLVKLTSLQFLRKLLMPQLTQRKSRTHLKKVEFFLSMQKMLILINVCNVGTMSFRQIKTEKDLKSSNQLFSQP